MTTTETIATLEALGNAAQAASDAAQANAGGPDAERYADAASTAWTDYRAALATAQRENPGICFDCDMPADRCPCRD